MNILTINLALSTLVRAGQVVGFGQWPAGQVHRAQDGFAVPLGVAQGLPRRHGENSALVHPVLHYLRLAQSVVGHAKDAKHKSN